MTSFAHNTRPILVVVEGAWLHLQGEGLLANATPLLQDQIITIITIIITIITTTITIMEDNPMCKHIIMNKVSHVKDKYFEKLESFIFWVGVSALEFGTWFKSISIFERRWTPSFQWGTHLHTSP